MNVEYFESLNNASKHNNEKYQNAEKILEWFDIESDQ
jgi:hypothetical protein